LASVRKWPILTVTELYIFIVGLKPCMSKTFHEMDNNCYYLVTSSYLCFSTTFKLDVLFWTYHYRSHYVCVTLIYCISWHTIGSCEKNMKMKYGDTRFLPGSELMPKVVASTLKKKRSREVNKRYYAHTIWIVIRQRTSCRGRSDSKVPLKILEPMALALQFAILQCCKIKQK